MNAEEGLNIKLRRKEKARNAWVSFNWRIILITLSLSAFYLKRIAFYNKVKKGRYKESTIREH